VVGKRIFGIFGVFWSLLGFSLIIGSAIIRLSERILEVNFSHLNGIQTTFLIGFTFFMLMTEGYGGFHKRLSPRFASRAKHLLHKPRLIHVMLAPFFCVGYFHALRRRVISSFSLTFMIVLLIIIVSHMSQPWRGLIDVGVVAGLIFGILSLFLTLFSVLILGSETADPEFPEKCQS
jgi:hypothetical protein